ncbi:MAG: vWA domain-containing protein [Planctomycetota bacterium]
MAEAVGKNWSRNSLALSFSLLAHALIVLLLALIVFAVAEEPETEAIVTLETTDVSELIPVPTEGSVGGGAPSLQTVSEVALSEAVAAPQLAVAMPATLGAQPTAPDATVSLYPTATDPALAILAELASAPAATAAVGQGANPLLDGIGPGVAEGLGQLGRRGLDVVFVLDATESMRDEISQAKDRVRDIHAVVTGLLSGDDGPARNVRFGVVAFKDFGDDYGLDATRTLPLNNDPEQLEAFLDRVFVDGGGDIPEPIHLALEAATDTKMGWERKKRHHIIVLVTDAPVHSNGRKQARATAERFVKKHGGVTNVIDVATDRDHILADLEAIAAAGGGRAFRVEDEETFWRDLVVSIFPKRFAHDVAMIVERYAKNR